MISAVTHVRAMRGGAQSHLIQADDGHHYVVKFLNNPQHPRVLANEWLAQSIARCIGLSVPDFDVMEVPPEFIAANPSLSLRIGGRDMPVAACPGFASQLPTGDPHAPVYDYLPEPALERVENLDEFAGVLALDQWLANCDGRQAIFCRPNPRRSLRALFIDFGFCFNAGDWTFPDSPHRGLYPRNAVYRNVAGWESFEPWLSRIESFRMADLFRFITRLPLEWYDDGKALVALLDRIHERQRQVRTLIHAIRTSPRAPFEHWTGDRSPAPASNGRSNQVQPQAQRSLL